LEIIGGYSKYNDDGALGTITQTGDDERSSSLSTGRERDHSGPSS